MLVPPNITEAPLETDMFTTNGNQSFSVLFESKNSENNTLVSWSKDATSLQDSTPRYVITNTFYDSLTGETRLTFPSLGRRDKGVYRVVIENPHRIIPRNLRRVETQFAVDVSILPATPTNLIASSISDTTATLSWSLPFRTTDEAADSQTITVRSGNSVVLRRVVEGSARQLLLSLTPAQQYNVSIVAANQDGNVTSNYYLFQTSLGGMYRANSHIELPAMSLIFAAPLMSEVSIRRNNLRNNTLHVTATLAYTGGGAIQLFVISYREIGTTSWIAMDRNFTASAEGNSLLVWSANIVDDAFQELGIELQVKVVNSQGYVSNCLDDREEIGK